MVRRMICVAGLCAAALGAFGGCANARDKDNTLHPLQSGQITLTASAATMVGSDAKLEKYGTQLHIGYWERESTFLTWTAKNVQPGTYAVDALYSLDPQYVGSTIAMTVGTQTLSKKLAATKNWDDYHAVHLGDVRIDKAGDATLTMKVTDKPTLFVMNLQNVTLTPR